MFGGRESILLRTLLRKDPNAIVRQSCVAFLRLLLLSHFGFDGAESSAVMVTVCHASVLTSMA